jgi:hypothetical protein
MQPEKLERTRAAQAMILTSMFIVEQVHTSVVKSLRSSKALRENRESRA